MPLTYPQIETNISLLQPKTLEMTLDVFLEYAVDEAKEVDGVWKDLTATAKVLVARAGNKKYARLLSSEVEKNQRALDLKTEAAEALSDRIMIDVLAQTVLLGWEGIKFKGQDLPYSRDNAKMLLAVKDFRGVISRLAADFANYRVAQEEALGKN